MICTTGHVTYNYEADDITDSFIEEFVSVTHDDAEEAQEIEFQKLLAKVIINYLNYYHYFII